MSFTSWAISAVFAAGLVVSACGSDHAATAADTYCAATKSALAKCKDPQPCDTTLNAQCGGIAKAVSPSTADAAKNCLESGVCGAANCLTRAQKAAKPTQAHADLATKYCTMCAPDVPDCVAQFYQTKSKLPGVLVLPYSDVVAKAVADACTTDAGRCRAAFATCATNTITTSLATVVPADMAACVTGAFQHDDEEGTPVITPGGAPQVQTCTPDNCKGCCREDKCIDGTQPDACGTNAVACQTCSTVQMCTPEGQCHEPCGPNNCKGCCDNDSCIPGDITEKCGGEGMACTKCDATNPNLACSDQKCVDVSCTATCLTGCCTATGCQLGTEASACGINAAACIDCGYGRTCGSHACVLDENSLWDFYVAYASFPDHKNNGDNWDPFYGLPDPYLKAYSNLGAASHTGQTAVDADTTSPLFIETPLKGISAKELISNLSFELWDQDIDFDDLIGGCKINVTAAQFNGTLQTQNCGATPSTVAITLSYRLFPHSN